MVEAVEAAPKLATLPVFNAFLLPKQQYWKNSVSKKAAQGPTEVRNNIIPRNAFVGSLFWTMIGDEATWKNTYAIEAIQQRLDTDLILRAGSHCER